MLPRGLRLVLRDRRLFLLGALPPLITSALMIAVIVVLGVFAGDLVAWMTPFADGWRVAGAFRVIMSIALVLAAVLIMVLTFTALTLSIGAPMYDKISELVDRSEEGAAGPPPGEPIVRAALRAIGQTLVLVGISALVGVVLFALGFLPVVGQTVVPAVAALFGGWMLAGELTGSAFERRGLAGLRSRFAGLRRRRLRVLAFGVPCFLLLSVPLLAVFVFPAAAAGGTLLARSLSSDEPAEVAARRT